MLVHDFLINSAERFPHKTALVCGGQRLTYAGILERSRRWADALRALGMQRQDRVVIFCENSIEAVVALFGTLMAGGIFVLLNLAMKAKKLAYILNNSGAHVLIAQPNKLNVLREAVAEALEVRHLV